MLENRWKAQTIRRTIVRMKRMPGLKEMQEAFLRGDPSYDRIFFTGVRTTGIFCKPSCPAKKPRIDNVSFFYNAREALFAGYRPCLRCRPLEATDVQPHWVTQLMQRIEHQPHDRVKESDLRSLGIDPEKARRYFLRHYGMTFHAYQRARRLGAAFQQIRAGASLDEVTFESGYESHSGFRDAFGRVFGKAPGRARNDECVLIDWVDTPLGPMVIGGSSSGLCLLEFTDRRMLEAQFATIKKRFRFPLVPGRNSHTDQTRVELQEYFGGKRKTFDLKLQYDGTSFEEKVWSALLSIPYGQTRSYEELAAALGNRAAVRAVGRANGMNRIAIVIPCHRVVNKDGKLGGYGGGLWRKQYLLDMERSASEFELTPL